MMVIRPPHTFLDPPTSITAKFKKLLIKEAMQRLSDVESDMLKGFRLMRLLHQRLETLQRKKAALLRTVITKPFKG